METNINDQIKMEDKTSKCIKINNREMKSATDLRTSFEGSVHSEYDFQEYHHTSTVYSNSYDGDDEVFLTEESTESVRITTREPRPRRISDVIDSIGDSSPPKETTHFTFPDFHDGSGDFSVNNLLLSSSRFQSPPVTPGSDVGYYSTGLSTPPSINNYKMWSTVNSPTMEEILKIDVTDGSKWDDTDAKPTNAQEICMSESIYAQRKVVAKMPVPRDSSEYNMNHSKRGVAIVFNNENFKTNQTRKGSNVDVFKLNNILETLGFEVTVHDDLGYDDIRMVIDQLVKRDYSDCDCLLMAVLTHGRINNYLQSKDHLYPLDMLWKPFAADNCPTLAGKPKIFFIQACKGENLDGGTRLVSAATETDSAHDSYTIPCMADFLLAYSTVEGYFSWRNPENGTWFIKSLCEVMQEYHQTTDLLKMLTIVARRVAIDFESFNDLNPAHHGQKQVPSIFSTLIRDVYFRPKI